MNLNQVTIHSKNLNDSIKFYQKLGLSLIVDSRPRYVRFELPKGDSTFSISQSDEKLVGHSVLYFEVDNVDQTYRNLKSCNIEFENTPKTERWLWREVSLKDPDGHQLKIYSAGENRKYPPWRIKSKRWFDSICSSPHYLFK